MTILNHITLEALARLPIAEIVGLPATELARLQHEAKEALRKAKDAGWKDATWARRDPDLAILHGDPDFDALYPPGAGECCRQARHWAMPRSPQ